MSRMLWFICLDYTQRHFAKEKIQEFLKRVRNFGAGNVRLMQPIASVIISPAAEAPWGLRAWNTDMATAEAARGCLEPGWLQSGNF